MADETFWNFEPTPARKVKVVVGPSERPTWWCADLEGTEREAVEVNYNGEIFYLDNQGGPSWPAGEGWNKVTKGRGSPDWGHSEIPVREVVEDEDNG